MSGTFGEALMETYAWLAVLTLANGFLIAMKIIERRNQKAHHNPDLPCSDHRERLGRIEERLDGIDARLSRIERKLDL